MRLHYRQHKAVPRRAFTEAKVGNVTEREIRDQFFRTRDAAAAIANRTARVDTIVQQRWLSAQTAGVRGAPFSSMPGNVALLAVGGYGRLTLIVARQCAR